MLPARETFMAAGTPLRIWFRFQPAWAALLMPSAMSWVVNRLSLAHCSAASESRPMAFSRSAALSYWVRSATLASSM